jgi:hypothetical protein
MYFGVTKTVDLYCKLNYTYCRIMSLYCKLNYTYCRIMIRINCTPQNVPGFKQTKEEKS